MEEKTFSWFPFMTKVFEETPDEVFKEFVMAVANYGTYGIEPEFTNPFLKMAFEGLRKDIDNSHDARNKNKGGRPSKKTKENGSLEQSETNETPVLEVLPEKETEKTSITPVSEVSEVKKPTETNETPVMGFEKSENPSLYTKPFHSIPSNSKENSSNEELKKGTKAKAFRPPSPEDVEAYSKSRGFPIDGQKFCDFYASKGWFVGKSKMKDWKAAVRTWISRQKDNSGQAKEVGLSDVFEKYDSIQVSNAIYV